MLTLIFHKLFFERLTLVRVGDLHTVILLFSALHHNPRTHSQLYLVGRLISRLLPPHCLVTTIGKNKISFKFLKQPGHP